MIGIICFWDRAATPYLAKYEQLLHEQNAPFDVIMWSRKSSDNEISVKDNIITINQECSGSKVQKMRAFFKWRRTIIKLLSEKKYDALIVLSTVPAVLLYFQLVGKYTERFIFDIRDYTLEKNMFFKNVVMNLVKNSAFTAISSKGYMRWLDDSEKININHNITIEDETVEFPSYKNKKTYSFAFVGNVRLDTQTKALLLQLNNNPNFYQYFYGRIVPGCEIEQLKEDYNIKNLFLPGAFTVHDKKNIFKDVDIINCVYANAEKEEDISLGDSTPLPNRLYDAITFYRPIVCSKGTYLSELVEQYHLGCSINGFDRCAGEQILRYLQEFDLDSFIMGCNLLRKVVLDEERRFKSKCSEIIRGWNK